MLQKRNEDGQLDVSDPYIYDNINIINFNLKNIHKSVKPTPLRGEMLAICFGLPYIIPSKTIVYTDNTTSLH